MFRHEIIDNYTKKIKKTTKKKLSLLKSSIFKAVKFASYFDLNHLETFNWSIFENKEGDSEEIVEQKETAKKYFENFVKIIQKEKEANSFGELSFNKYTEIITNNSIYSEVRIN